MQTLTSTLINLKFVILNALSAMKSVFLPELNFSSMCMQPVRSMMQMYIAFMICINVPSYLEARNIAMPLPHALVLPRKYIGNTNLLKLCHQNSPLVFLDIVSSSRQPPPLCLCHMEMAQKLPSFGPGGRQSCFFRSRIVGHECSRGL